MRLLSKTHYRLLKALRRQPMDPLPPSPTTTLQSEGKYLVTRSILKSDEVTKKTRKRTQHKRVCLPSHYGEERTYAKRKVGIVRDEAGIRLFFTRYKS